MSNQMLQSWALFHSAEGAIKVWESDKTLLTEISLDEGISSATFLNNQGDVLVGYKNHIFIIGHSKGQWTVYLSSVISFWHYL